MSDERIVLSYRRDDAPGHAGRIFDRLRGRFGERSVFADATDIRSDLDPVVQIERAMRGCDVLVVIVGPRWSSPADDGDADPRRLIALGIDAAVARDVPIVPVLVDRAGVPSADGTPGAAALARRRPLEVSDDHFETDVAHLIDLVKQYLDAAEGSRPDPTGVGAPATRRGIEIAYPEPPAGSGAAADRTSDGRALDAPGPDVRHESRKTVTALFCDLVASTSLGEAMDPEALSHILDRYFAEMHRVIALHGGLTEWYAGDSITAVFGLPTLHEDDALRAVRAAWDMRDALAEVNAWLAERWDVRLRARSGINTGEVLVGPATDRKRLVVGDAINTAARLEQVAEPGDILIGPVTRQLVRGAFDTEPVEPLHLKGKALPVPAWRVVGRRTSGGDGRPEGVLVDRRKEMALLDRAYERAVADRSCYLFTLIGVAGVGKTRLLGGFGDEVDDEARVLTGRCLPYGQAITYLPFAEAIRQAAGLDGGERRDDLRTLVGGLVQGARDADRLADTLAQVSGLEPVTASPEELSWAVRGLLEHLARERPLVLAVEDIHWAEPTLLDLLEHLADWTREAPILLICSARHELLEVRPGWGGGKLRATVATLEPLAGPDGEEMMRNLMGGGDLSPRLRRWISRKAEGNPLFVEELIRLLTEQGRLHREDTGWEASGDLSEIEVPPSITALIAARVDGLGPDTREVLERASVIGRSFRLGELHELCTNDLQPRLRQELMTLIRKELIVPVASQAGDEQFRFRHNLIRDAAYAAMPKEMRGFLHERFAFWLEDPRSEASGDTDRPGEIDEIVGYQFEQAYLNLNAVRPGTAREHRLAARAAERLAAAGARASARGDVRRALGLLSRAVDITPPDAPDRLELLVNLAQVLLESGEFGRAAVLMQEVIDAARAAGDQRIEAHARLLILWGELFSAPDVDLADVRAEAERLLSVFNAHEDELGLARGWTILGELHLADGQAEAAAADAARAVRHARQAAQGWLVSVNLSLQCTAVASGPMPVREGIDQCRAALAEIAGNPVAEAWISRSLARLLAMQGEFDQARTLISAGREVMDQFGYGFILAGGLSLSAGYVEELSGDFAAAEAALRWGHRILEQMGERSLLSTVAARLARVLLEEGPDHLPEAERFAAQSERAVGRLLSSQIAARSVKALVLSAAGDGVRALKLGREALAISERTDMLVDQAETHAALARVLAADGRDAEAADERATARALFTRKGNVVAVAALDGGAGPP